MRALLICDLQAPDDVPPELERDDHDVPGDCVKFGVDNRNEVSEQSLCLLRGKLVHPHMLDLPCVESATQDVRVVVCARCPLEAQLLLSPTCDDLAVEFILPSVIQVQGASLTFQHVIYHFHQTRQVKFYLGIACNILNYVE